MNPKIKFIPRNLACKKSDLQDFETELGAKLPKDFHEFLLKYNGPDFEAPEGRDVDGLKFVPPLSTEDGTKFFLINEFLAPTIEEDGYGLRQVHEAMRETWLYPIIGAVCD